MTDFETAKLITPAQLRAVVVHFLGKAEEMDAAYNPFNAVSARTYRIAADTVGDLLQSALTQAEAEEREQEARRAAAAEEARKAREEAAARAEAYRTRPIKGLRDGDFLATIPSYTRSRWDYPSVHIAYKDDDGDIRLRCGADLRAAHNPRAEGDWQREANCKVCLRIAAKEGLLAS